MPQGKTLTLNPPGFPPVRGLAETPDVLLVRHKNGRRPQLHFKPRGGESMWNDTLETIIHRSNLPPIPYTTLKTIHPYLIELCELVAGHLMYRKQNFTGMKWHPPDHVAHYAGRLYELSTPVLKNTLERLLNLTRSADALDLIAAFFPQRLHEINAAEDWVTTFRRFLLCVEDADWFPLDMELLEMAYLTWNEDRDEDNGEWLANFLICIPIPVFSPIEEDLDGGDDITRILFGLLQNHYMLGCEDLIPWGLNPSDINEEIITTGIRNASRDNVYLAENYGVPLNFLPGIAAMYRRETGFNMIDAPGQDGGYAVWGQNPDFTWDHDVDRLRKEWQACRPLVDRWDAFHAWCSDEANFHRALDLILKLGGVI